VECNGSKLPSPPPTLSLPPAVSPSILLRLFEISFFNFSFSELSTLTFPDNCNISFICLSDSSSFTFLTASDAINIFSPNEECNGSKLPSSTFSCEPELIISVSSDLIGTSSLFSSVLRVSVSISVLVVSVSICPTSP